MRIQFIPKYYATNCKKPKSQNNQHSQNNIIHSSYNPIAYQDYNISFGARTPENFYEFNAESMPYSMRNYLNYDKEQRQHMPPEQMMNEVFKHLDNAENFEDVKRLYPNEDLFKNLHPLRKNSRKGILSEIKVARDLSDTPLLKDGSDDFGMYLLKKIYKEGKTLKEISKDFLEKDINEEYKGFITEPITYDTTSAYGIKFPNNGFWHSFISTREEYKQFFITLPKNTIDPNRLEARAKSESTGSKTQKAENNDDVQTPKKQVRKYKTPKYKRDQLTKDIHNAKGEIDGVERAIRKRFSKDDPEASFMIKYLSPIMTVAADRVHLSEEMRYFFDTDDKNKQFGQSEMQRFWKSNPELLGNYSTAITDTIELFESVYGAGGMIPINNLYEEITSKTENQKAIDYVTPEFLELLDYTQHIKPLRDERYAKHDIEQQEWEAHFKERYGDVIEEARQTEQKTAIPPVSTVKEAMDNAMKANPGVKFYDFVIDNDTKVSFAVNLEEVTADKLKGEYCNMPASFIAKYTKFFLSHPKADEKLLLSLACAGKEMKDLGTFLADKNYTEEEMNDMNAKITEKINERLYSPQELFDIMNKIYSDFEQKNPKFMTRVQQAIMEYSTRLTVPDNEYLKQLIDERYKQMEEAGLISDGISNENKLATYTTVYRQAMDAIASMKSHNIVFLNTRSLEAGLSFLRIGNTIENYPVEMDKIMRKYTTPLTNNEKNKIIRVFMDSTLNMDPYETESFKTPELSGFFKACMEALKRKENNKFKKEFINMVSSEVVTSDNTTLRYLIDPNADKNLIDAKVEFEVGKLMQKDIEVFKILACLDKDIMDKYIKNTNPDMYAQLLAYRQVHMGADF